MPRHAFACQKPSPIPTVIIEQISDTELRIRKAKVIPTDELPFLEDGRRLSPIRIATVF